MTLEQMEERIGRLLSVGTAISSGLLAVGLILSIAGGPPALAASLLTAGLMVLIATPIGRVIASAVGFMLQRDWQMVVMTALVLASLFASLAVAMLRL
jgi:uncharacterized membrane protein